ncbi:MAG: transcription antitermination factor NusB [Betaproteobacteria bacterium]|nr:transcription antitermination factor NusB [Betaproteobacteria bacterium]
MKSGRRRAREFALQALYQWMLAGTALADLEKQVAEMEGYKHADAALFKALLAGVTRHHEAHAQALAPHLDRDWKDVSPIERAILLIGTHELASMPETPYRVAINESIELGKVFGGTDGHKYVNGILDRLAAVVRADEVAAQSGGQPPARAKAPRKAAPVVVKKVRKVSK